MRGFVVWECRALELDFDLGVVGIGRIGYGLGVWAVIVLAFCARQYEENEKSDIANDAEE